MTITQARGANIINDVQKAQIEGGLQQLGMTTAQINAITIAGAQTTFISTSTTLAATAGQLTTNSAKLGDKTVDTKQTGAGFTPIIGFDISLEKLNIGLKYEFQTTLELTNETTKDDMGLFPDGGKSRSDLPAILAAGAEYKVSDALKVSGSYTLYFDKNVNWGKNIYLQDRTIDKNYVELALGVEYKLNDAFALSAGYLNSNMGVSEQYQSDFSYANDSYTVGLGFQWNMNKRLVLDAGMMLTTYKDDTKSFTDALGTYQESYGKDTFGFGIGIGYKIF